MPLSCLRHFPTPTQRAVARAKLPSSSAYAKYVAGRGGLYPVPNRMFSSMR